MKLKYNFATVGMGDQSVAVAVGQSATQFRGMIQCNETAAVILELLKEETSEEQIIAALKQQYEAEDGEIEAEVRRCLDVFRAYDLLD